MSTIPKLSWVSCMSGRPGCLQLSDGSSSGDFFNHTGEDAIRISFRKDGTPSLLVLIVTPPNRCCGEDIFVYDLSTLAPLAAWREDLLHCYAVVRPADGVLAFDLHRDLDANGNFGTDAIAVGTPSALSASLVMTEIPEAILPHDDWVEDIAVTTSTVAFTSNQQRAARAPLASSSFAPLQARRVWAHGDDVFALNLEGAVEYVAADGTLTPLIPQPTSGDLEEFAADDAHIAWTSTSTFDSIGTPWTSPAR